MKKEITTKYFKESLTVARSLITIVMFTLLPLVGFTLITSNSNLLLGFKSFVVLSGSMQPLIPTGSIVYSLKDTIYQTGDIISFAKGKQTITHRIVEVQDEKGLVVSPLISPIAVNKEPRAIFFKTQGDANNAPDNDLIPQNNVIGRALFHLPYVGRLIVFLKTISGFVLFLVIPTFIFIGFELWNIKKEIEKGIEKRWLIRMQQFQDSGKIGMTT